MKLNTLMRPSMLPTAVCTLPVSLPATAAPVAPLAVERPWAPRVHQVLIQVQSELGKSVLVLVDGNLVDGNKGTTGFKGNAKRYTDGGSGVPPRGRPV
ncbi:hypothetical protein [Actinoplanes sp. GCM10030250]|uniref:hypothetical protein n=1 Tax=Actinoplanes sp. GCM10030250 TaxID=3273376 RepID=UPI00362139EE